MNTLKEYTALVPMGGSYEGQIALHSHKSASFEGAKEWANRRFVHSADVAIVEDKNYPDLYKLDQEKLKELYLYLIGKS